MLEHKYIQILRKELVPALGCTEPIALAYAAAKAREVLGEMPDRITVLCSGNIIKNVKGVTVPMSDGMKGIIPSVLLGLVGGDADRSLEVLTTVTPQDIEETKALIEKKICTVKLAEGVENLYIKITLSKGDDLAVVEIKGEHTNITKIEKNGRSLFEASEDKKADKKAQNPYNFEEIYDFANNVDIDEIKDLIKMQISHNLDIANEGLLNPYGANVGKTLLASYGDDVRVRAKAYAAAGSDARMSGCSKPVVINSGSGNQGLTVSLPVIIFAHELGASEEKLIRALVFSNLIALMQKERIGKLSAYCGAVSAACGAGAAIAYLHDRSKEEIVDTITNTLGNVSGIVCDGAKPSCAAKIASSVDAAIMGYTLAVNKQRFNSGEGLVKDTVEDTIRAITQMAKDGMKLTDVEILNIMIED
ncbi:MAG: L-serine ammonia-lyase, iron-sulfur-dependent, subunit alpha [Peptostreptococcaceae bacterium]|nr:L-serine ammonia-lyase, iron-sulfur-dependent, subunit alpha [Peptostreptococcaceae bacterium]